MGISIVVGGQYGHEGKGKVTKYFAEKYSASSVVRIADGESEHTVSNKKGELISLRVLPSVAVCGHMNCIIPKGSYFDPEILFHEIMLTGIDESRIKIHPDAGLISEGGITIDGMSRASMAPYLKPYLCDTTEFLRAELDNEEKIIIEGIYGYGVSNQSIMNGDYMDDMTAAGMLSKAGLSPLDVTEVIMVLSAFPVMDSHLKAKLPQEMTWEELSKYADKEIKRIKGRTSEAENSLRVARFDANIVKKSMAINNPTKFVLNFMDYVPMLQQKDFLMDINSQLGIKIGYVGHGPCEITSIWSEYL